MPADGRRRVVIENVKPEIDAGRFPIKRIVGQEVSVEADVFADGHDLLVADLLYRRASEAEWRIVPMNPLPQDRWRGTFSVAEIGEYEYTIRGKVDHFATWRHDLGEKAKAGLNVGVELQGGALMLTEAAKGALPERAAILNKYAGKLKGAEQPESVTAALSEELALLMRDSAFGGESTTYDRILRVIVDPKIALFSAWYELFPRSCNGEHHGTFKDCMGFLPRLARMGFDILYLPPIHPIGRKNRKGSNNSPVAGPEDPGSPWAIGSSEGGHKTIHPSLGTMEDFEALVARAREFGMEVALDLAFQCSQDHPYIKEHPEWFAWRPDGSIQFAENPPKKYEDVVPFNFENENWRGLWEELKSIALFWIEKGVRIFRVDNPHTKPFVFWEWLISEIKGERPDVIFLSEAFTRPLVKYRLAKLGFSQSYTYFTWRNNKREIMAYMAELTRGEPSEYFRPNFWPNTPDILPEYLQYGGRPAFIIRLALAATLSSNYGNYGPPNERMISEAVPGKEEYRDSEKYEIRTWDLNGSDAISAMIERINKVRRENPALQETNNLRFIQADNEFLLAYIKSAGDNLLLIIVNLDPFHTQSGWVTLPLEELRLNARQNYLVHDLISAEKYLWHGPRNFVELNPGVMPAHILRIFGRMRRESDFDYFM